VTTRSYRPTRAEIAPGAIRRNVERIGVLVAPAAVCAVVKGDGYGHGIVTAATAALEGGATWLGVALAEEAFALRDAGFTVPVLLLSEPVAAAWGDLVAGDIDVAVYSQAAIGAAQSAAASAGPGRRAPPQGRHGYAPCRVRSRRRDRPCSGRP
jgi:alanine racemase